ncbi:amidase [Paraflavitalea soli]|uniref:N-acetylmuramoyl-L-alanine amidase n=1 Tax=Paraflavitalea soli TaxID=2315862 RepID=A0A3B7MUB0_9BACT|nr:N-acetylmuramoyl-L-alanine amidase [Paraflavitalea soli]AXY77457.1 amidase [Paraflavitalea soli]
MPGTFNEKFIVIPRYLPVPSRRRAGTPIQKVRFLVAHDTGNPGSTAANNIQFYINTAKTVEPAKTASAHLFVDDKEILECVPALTASAEKAFHVLKKVTKDNELYGINANDGAIGVEYCYGGAINADKAYEKFVWTLAKLCFVYNLNPAKDIVGHFFLDPARKTDPVTGLARSRRTYEQLLRDVAAEFETCTGNAPAGPTTTAQTGSVTVTVKLNLRKAPNTRAAIVQVVPAGTVLQFTATIPDGEPVNNNPLWYQDTHGNYFWSGGVK